MLGRLAILCVALIGVAKASFVCKSCFGTSFTAQSNGPTPDQTSLQSAYAIFGFPMDKMPPYVSECASDSVKTASVNCNTYCLEWYISIPSENVTRYLRGCYDLLTGSINKTPGASKALTTADANADQNSGTSDPQCIKSAGAKFWMPDGKTTTGTEILRICDKNIGITDPCNYKGMNESTSCSLTNPDEQAGTCYECRDDNYNGQCDDSTCSNQAAYCTKTWTQIDEYDGGKDYVTEKGCSMINPHFDNYCTATGNYTLTVYTRSSMTTYNTSSCFCKTNECNAGSALLSSLFMMATLLGLNILY